MRCWHQPPSQQSQPFRPLLLAVVRMIPSAMSVRVVVLTMHRAIFAIAVAQMTQLAPPAAQKLLVVQAQQMIVAAVVAGRMMLRAMTVAVAVAQMIP